MFLEMSVFAVERHKALRSCQRVHDLQLLHAGVSRNVNLCGAVVDDLRAALQKLVHNA